MTQTKGAWRANLEEAVFPVVVALLVAAVVGDILILAFGQNPGAVYRLLFEGTWGNSYGFGQVLYKTTTLTFTGLAVAMGLRAGLFNIGAESQLAAGGFVAALVGLILPAGIPALVTIPIYIVAAAVGGGTVGALPGALKARFGAHEVITTIMLNFIVLALLNYLTVTFFKVDGTLHTGEIRDGALPRLSDFIPAFHGSAANVVLFLALAVALVAWWFLFRSPSTPRPSARSPGARSAPPPRPLARTSPWRVLLRPAAAPGLPRCGRRPPGGSASPCRSARRRSGQPHDAARRSSPPAGPGVRG